MRPMIVHRQVAYRSDRRSRRDKDKTTKRPRSIHIPNGPSFANIWDHRLTAREAQIGRRRAPSSLFSSPLSFLSIPRAEIPKSGEALAPPPHGDASLGSEASGEEFEMGSPENPNWILDCPLLDDIPVSGADFTCPTSAGFYWQTQGVGGATAPASVEANCCFVEPNGLNGAGSQKRARQESCGQPGSKACREKLRRDRLNDKFLELGSILEPGKQPKMDKAAILSDAAHMVTQLRNEAKKLKESNESLQEKIRELKSEKNELRDEKQRLKTDKENLEQQIKTMTMPPSFLPHPPVMPNPFMAPVQAAGNKLLMPYIYPGVMFQFQSPPNADEKNELPPAA